MAKERKLLLDPLQLREQWRRLPSYGCFWSSPDNPRGLRLTPTIELGRVFVEMTIDREHSGFPGIAHGGIAFTILDGLMGWFIMAHEGRAGFTTQSAVQYRAPLLVGRRYLFEALDDTSAKPADGTVSLLGRVFEAVASPGNKDPLLEIKATFFLPNRKTAIRVLGVPLGAEGEHLFPED